MKYYKAMIEKGCFTWHDVCDMLGNRNTASTIIQSYIQKGYIQSVKRNLYVTLDLVTQSPTVNKFQIASSITKTAYVYGFSAFDYHGYTNQVSYDVYVASDTRFDDFNYDGITYRYVKTQFANGIIQDGGIKVTDVERSVLDCINTFDKYGGIEELLHCIELIPYLNEDKLIMYLKEYNKAALYQKTGFILEHFKDELYMSNGFFDECKKHIGKSVRYLYRKNQMNNQRFNKIWQLMVPMDFDDITYQGGLEDEEI